MFDLVYNFLSTTIFNSSVPYAELLTTLSSGALCFFIIYLMFIPFITLFRGIFSMLFGR